VSPLAGFDRFHCLNQLRTVVTALFITTVASATVAAENLDTTRSNQTAAAIHSCESIIETGMPTWLIDGDDKLLSNSVKSEAFDNPRAHNSTRYFASPSTGTDIVWTSLQTAEAPVAMQITISTNDQPTTLWHLNESCIPTQHRELIYDDTDSAIELHIVSLNDGSTENVEPLNPPVPTPIPVKSVEPEETKVRVAMVDAGVNYTLPELNTRLARDKTGKLIGYDFWDNDTRPFDAQFGPSPFHVVRHGTATASILLNEAPFVELVPYRYPRSDMSRMKQLVEHAAANDVSIVGLPLGSNTIEQWEVFEKTAQHASAGNNGRNIDSKPVYPAALDLNNLLVVTSADDFVVPAEGVNWGRTNVDYMLPAENRTITQFDGESGVASGSSYAVPRALGMAARWQRDNPSWRAKELIREFARRYADGASANYVSGGYIADPIAQDDMNVNLVGVQTLARDKPSPTDENARQFKLPLSVFVLNDQWTSEQINQSLLQAESILSQCQLAFNSVTISQLSLPEYLQDLDTGATKTLLSALQNDSEFKPIKVFFARDTNMLLPSDGASFARANTRRRPWLQDSVWLTQGIDDSGIALAHELFHVLSNTGVHSRANKNLMKARTSPDNTELQTNQCEAAIAHAKDSLLVFD